MIYKLFVSVRGLRASLLCFNITDGTYATHMLHTCFYLAQSLWNFSNSLTGQWVCKLPSEFVNSLAGLYTNQVDWIDWFDSTRILSWLDWVDWLFEMTGWLTRLTLATGWLIWFPKIRVTRMIESIEWKVQISFSWRKIMTPIDDIKDHKTTLKTACHHNCNMG